MSYHDFLRGKIAINDIISIGFQVCKLQYNQTYFLTQMKMALDICDRRTRWIQVKSQVGDAVISQKAKMSHTARV